MIRIRWRIFSFLFGFGFIAYVQQKGITVAADRMMPELHLSQFQIGLLLQAFVLGYALFQLPGGVLGQRLGARRTFVVIGLAAFLATIATPLAPDVFAGYELFIALFTVQVLLGCAQGGIFPVSAGVFEEWFPPRHWSLVQGLQTMGLSLGAALTQPLIASLMTRFGWQSALFWSALPTLALIGLWGWYGRNSPRQHSSVTAQELAEIGASSPGDSLQDASAAGTPAAGTPAATASINVRRLLQLLTERNVLLLAVSYLCMNYTFYLLSNWVFLYLVQERKFSLSESGWLSTAPPLAAALGAGVGGVITAICCRRYGERWGYRSVPLVALPAAAVLLLLAVNTSNSYFAVAALAACFGCVELTEGAFWSAGMIVGRGDTMSVCGIMNTGGNLGGLIGIPIVAYLSGLHLWYMAFFIGIGFAMVSALAWLGIDVAVPVTAPREAAALADIPRAAVG